jgi:hypothetical protein
MPLTAAGHCVLSDGKAASRLLWHHTDLHAGSHYITTSTGRQVACMKAAPTPCFDTIECIAVVKSTIVKQIHMKQVYSQVSLIEPGTATHYSPGKFMAYLLP